MAYRLPRDYAFTQAGRSSLEWGPVFVLTLPFEKHLPAALTDSQGEACTELDSFEVAEFGNFMAAKSAEIIQCAPAKWQVQRPQLSRFFMRATAWLMAAEFSAHPVIVKDVPEAHMDITYANSKPKELVLPGGIPEYLKGPGA